MRRFNKEEFLKLPAGVVYMTPAFSDIFIKGQTKDDYIKGNKTRYYEYGDIYDMIGYRSNLNHKYNYIYEDDSEQYFDVFEKNDLIALKLSLSNCLSKYPDFYPDFKENLKESAKWQNIINNKDEMKNEWD